jgi:hypothetical protein
VTQRGDDGATASLGRWWRSSTEGRVARRDGRGAAASLGGGSDGQIRGGGAVGGRGSDNHLWS